MRVVNDNNLCPLYLLYLFYFKLNLLYNLITETTIILIKKLGHVKTLKVRLNFLDFL